MTAWRSVPQAEAVASWDNWLLAIDDACIHQAYAWGRVKEQLGWRVIRLAAGESGKLPTALVQALVRRYKPWLALAWIPGGPAGDLNACGQPLREALQRAAGSWQIYCRMNSLRPASSAADARMAELGWRRPSANMNTGLSLIYEPGIDEETRLGMASANWRHNLKRSGKYGLALRRWDRPDEATVMELYRAMEQYKDLAPQISREEIRVLLDTLSDQLIIYRCDDTEGLPIAMRGCAILGNKAWDILAATTPAARKVYASHAAFWALMRECADRGVSEYDMGGVDPVGNRGVYDFKKGSGAQPLTYLGEWEWATTRILGCAANWLIRKRNGRL